MRVASDRGFISLMSLPDQDRPPDQRERVRVRPLEAARPNKRQHHGVLSMRVSCMC